MAAVREPVDGPRRRAVGVRAGRREQRVVVVQVPADDAAAVDGGMDMVRALLAAAYAGDQGPLRS